LKKRKQSDGGAGVNNSKDEQPKGGKRDGDGDGDQGNLQGRGSNQMIKSKL